MGWWRVEVVNFRDLKVAAPLKRRAVVPGVRARLARFPRPKGRGPIEAIAFLYGRRCGRSYFRDLKVAAPLKLDGGAGAAQIVDHISAT